jgi:hypothetical protein
MASKSFVRTRDNSQRDAHERLYKESPSIQKTLPIEVVKDLSAYECTLKLTPRHEFVAKEGFSLWDGDFVNQEMCIAAKESGDITMTDALRQPKRLKETITLDDGTQKEIEYKNPDADLHIITTSSCYPQVFEGHPKWDWFSLSQQVKPGTNKKYRDIGKIINFGILFDQTAMTMATQNNVAVEEAKLWREGHEKAYPGWHRYAQEIGRIGAARGWIETSYGKRIRYVNEDNSKGEGSSPARSAVNMTIQGKSSKLCPFTR